MKLEMKMIKDYPPNIAAIRDRFGSHAIRNAIYTYGNCVYVPTGEILPEHLVAHEATHVQQQGDQPDQWWDRYLADDQFRLEQELEAYRVQYKYLEENCTRQVKRTVHQKIARDLSSVLYGKIISFDEAKELIKQ